MDETATRGVESGGGRLFALHCRVDGAIACQPWTTMRMVEQYDDVTSRQWHMAYGCRCMPRIAAAVALRRRDDAGPKRRTESYNPKTVQNKFDVTTHSEIVRLYRSHALKLYSVSLLIRGFN